MKESSKMKVYTETLICNTNAKLAWEALKNMNLWLPELSTNKSVNYDHDGDFFYQGRKYEVVTKEGIVMDCEIYMIDENYKKIEIHARHSILKSLLTCSIEEIDNQHCKLIRTQAYPGCFGFIFTKFFNRREARETSEYLKVWSCYAESNK